VVVPRKSVATVTLLTNQPTNQPTNQQLTD